jgi:peptidoglycan hydrolase-like protein with peptidoglycan-binding domain
MSLNLSTSTRAARGVARRCRRFSTPRIDRATVTPTLPRLLAPPRVAAAGTLAAALLLCLPGTGLAAGRPDGGEPSVIARGAGYALDGGSAQVRQLQRALRNGAYAPGPVDGVYGPVTEGAVRRFQQAHGLTIDGIVGPQTGAALRAASLSRGRPPPAIRPGAGYRSQGGSARVLEVQRMLSSLRYDGGSLDGLFGPRTQAAVQWFQVHHGLRPTGIVDHGTFTRLRALVRASPGIDGAASAELKVPPLPAAGWHGRPIRNPHRQTGAPTLNSVERARPLQLGAGYRRAEGSQRIRRVQRDLHRLGYRPGPVDGLFGSRTKASVQWFQMKVGLPPRGSVDAATLGHLRALASSDEPTQAHRKRATAPSQPSLATRTRRAVTLRDADEGSDGISAELILLGAAFGVAALALMTLTKSWPRRAQPVPAADPMPSTHPHAGAGDRKSPAPAPQTNGRQRSQRVVGYASAQDPAELERQAASIEQACRERGWTLACVIRENGSPSGNGRKRPGLGHAAKQVRAGLAARIVVASLDDLGHSEDEFRAQLVSAAADDVELVALDANGNGTPKGRRPKRVGR